MSHQLIHGWTRLDAFRNSDQVFRSFVSADVYTVTDDADDAFIDARSMTWNVTFGHNAGDTTAAVSEQLQKLACGPTIDGQTTEPSDEVARRLIELTGIGMTRVYLSLSGSAANEVAITLARSHFEA